MQNEKEIIGIKSRLYQQKMTYRLSEKTTNSLYKVNFKGKSIYSCNINPELICLAYTCISPNQIWKNDY